jgi:hypothetical protein
VAKYPLVTYVNDGIASAMAQAKWSASVISPGESRGPPPTMAACEIV